MDTNIKISNFIKGLLLIVISSFIFACSKCDGPVPVSSSNSNQPNSSSLIKDDVSLPSPNPLEKSKGVVGGDDNEDDDDNRGGLPKRK